MFKEFKEFISKGNVLDLAVGVIVGGAFGKIVTSLVDDIIMPIIGLIIGGIDFSGLSLKIGDATVNSKCCKLFNHCIFNIFSSKSGKQNEKN